MKRRRPSMSLIAAWAVIALGLVVTLFPLLWILLIALKTQRDAFTLPPVWFFQPIVDNFIAVWEKPSFRNAFVSSTMVTAIGVALALLIAVPAAYALERYRFGGKRLLLVWLLIAYMMPEFLYIIPMYQLFQWTGLYDTRVGLALAYQAFSLPFAVWMVRSFFREVPRELDDAARIDGCGTVSMLWHIYLPVAAPGIAATAILTGIWIWNEVAIALALTFRDAQTITVAVASFRGYDAIAWGPMAAASAVSMVPMLILAALMQRYIVKGLTLGAVK